MSAFDLDAYLKERRQLVDAALDGFLPREDTPPPSVHRAMRYSVLAGGKRLRPILVIAGAELVGAQPSRVIPTACALEMIHTYSLIHDDLPAMDDDDYRRGRLTNHKMFGDAIAILAGDALLTLAFQLVAQNAALTGVDARVVCDVVAEIAVAAGTLGMVGGQVVDIESEGKTLTPEALEYIHIHKTAALLRASLSVGARLGGADVAALAAVGDAGQSLGLAFQIIDDILDVEGSLATLGKTAGSDERKQKVTYPALHGIEASRREARRLIERTKSRLAVFGARSAPVCALADFVVERKS
ncbi:MAG: polyprenyl synthetase [Candidatus Rokuibacteriota bacterium]|nr:MAG: polyprenyl synthetase [Candidatus Rokubacteria bacterium]PYO04311.1 MAG: polyprenyl synthetase [Candidatus Rokubacteria bacterium]